jgi:hypothetical protein
MAMSIDAKALQKLLESLVNRLVSCNWRSYFLFLREVLSLLFTCLHLILMHALALSQLLSVQMLW